MRKIGILLAVLVLVCSSCAKKEEVPQYKGEIILSSELLLSGQSYVFYGFSFQTGQISTYSLTSSVKPDLAIINVELEDSVNLDMTGSDDQEAFSENGIFSTAGLAEIFFNNYTEVPSLDFQPIAHNIKTNQIWTIQTASKHFAKIWIREITVLPGTVSDYADIRIQYQYQPDGSRIFD
ncbi:hypothetical protein ACFLTU_03200 [Bacteroidota bacterium]